eukprot:g2848.t1
MSDLLDEILEPFDDDDYVLFDCPGQTELYAHTSVYDTLIEYLTRDDWTVCGVFCLDCQFVQDIPKFVAGSFQALIGMVTLSIPFINVLTKMDLVENKKVAEKFLMFDKDELTLALQKETGPKFFKLNSLVSHVQLFLLQFLFRWLN